MIEQRQQAYVVREHVTMLDGAFVSYRYRWDGDPAAPAYIRREWLADLPWPVEEVAPHNYSMRAALYVRTDVQGAAWRRWYWTNRIKATGTWRAFTERAIATLAIWGLAEWDMGRIPRWRDVRLPRRKR